MSAKLWQSPNPREKRSPIRIERHGKFWGGFTLTLIGARWSRTWGLLPAGTKIYPTIGCPTWLGGMSWRTRVRGVDTLTRPTIALCKWRYR